MEGIVTEDNSVTQRSPYQKHIRHTPSACMGPLVGYLPTLHLLAEPRSAGFSPKCCQLCLPCGRPSVCPGWPRHLTAGLPALWCASGGSWRSGHGFFEGSRHTVSWSWLHLQTREVHLRGRPAFVATGLPVFRSEKSAAPQSCASPPRPGATPNFVS